MRVLHLKRCYLWWLWCKTRILNGSVEELFRTVDFYTHIHTLNGWVAVFFMSLWWYRGVVKHFLLFVVLWTLKQRHHSITHIVWEEMCEVCSGCQEFLSQSRSHAHIHNIFQYFLCLTTVVATLIAIWHLVRNVMKNNSLLISF